MTSQRRGVSPLASFPEHWPFIGHTLAVWTYAFTYWLIADQLGGFAGLPVNDFTDCLYFSAVTYTSLGFGDHVPLSHLRLIAGVEALNGLLLIGWSASFTYLAMERYWPLHAERRSAKWTNRRDARAARRKTAALQTQD
jgi:hypothetical protein